LKFFKEIIKMTLTDFLDRILESEGKENVENIKKTRKYLEEGISEIFVEETSEKDGEKFKKIIERINDRNGEEETELLKLIFEIECESYFVPIKFQNISSYFCNRSGISEYLNKKMEELANGKNESKENEYHLIISFCLLREKIRKEDTKIIKKVIEFYKGVKMDRINRIEDKKKKRIEIGGLIFFLHNFGGLKENK